MHIFIIVLLLLVLLYLLSLSGRWKHPGLKALQGLSYAHRGLHGAGCPENSLAAFQAALERGFGAELDIHLLADGNLAVIHDSALLRTTGKEGRVEDLTTGQLKDYFLEGTTETIPEFSQVLALFKGKRPLIVELKSVDSNYAALCEAACKQLDGYNGPYCLESFDPRCVLWLKQHRPELVRGQLAENFLKTNSSISWFLRFCLTHQLFNFILRPDFVAYKYADRKNLGNFLVRRLWGIQGASWTLCSREEYDTVVKEGYLPIFEGFTP